LKDIIVTAPKQSITPLVACNKIVSKATQPNIIPIQKIDNVVAARTEDEVVAAGTNQGVIQIRTDLETQEIAEIEPLSISQLEPFHAMERVEPILHHNLFARSRLRGLVEQLKNQVITRCRIGPRAVEEEIAKPNAFTERNRIDTTGNPALNSNRLASDSHTPVANETAPVVEPNGRSPSHGF